MSFSPTKQFRLGTQHTLTKVTHRQKGAQNVSTGQAKAALYAVFESLGGVRGMTEWAMQPENRGEFYKLWSKLLPAEVDASDTRIQIMILPASAQPVPAPDSTQVIDCSSDRAGTGHAE